MVLTVSLLQNKQKIIYLSNILILNFLSLVLYMLRLVMLKLVNLYRTLKTAKNGNTV